MTISVAHYSMANEWGHPLAPEHLIGQMRNDTNNFQVGNSTLEANFR